MLAPVGDLGVDRFDQALATAPLRLRKLWLQIVVESRLLKIRGVMRGRNAREAEIDANHPVAVDRRRPLDLAHQIAVPAAAGILREVAGLDPALDVAVLPEAEFLPAQQRNRSFDRNVLVGEGEPAERALRGKALAPAQLRAARGGALGGAPVAASVQRVG